MADRNSFPKGNKLAKGGARPNAGAIPQVVKDNLVDMLNEPITDTVMEYVDGEMVRREVTRPITRKAFETLNKAMNGRDELGNVTAAAVRAAVKVWDKAFGKDRAQIEVTRKSEVLLGRIIDAQKAAEFAKVTSVTTKKVTKRRG